MPTYDYKCTACKHAFEQFQSMKDKPLKKCPKCGKNALERLIGTGAAVIFKGSGFYQTDYRSEAYKKAEKADSGDSSKATETKAADAKTADKTPARTEPAPAAAAAPAKVETPKPAPSKPEGKKKK